MEKSSDEVLIGHEKVVLELPLMVKTTKKWLILQKNAKNFSHTPADNTKYFPIQQVSGFHKHFRHCFSFFPWALLGSDHVYLQAIRDGRY